MRRIRRVNMPRWSGQVSPVIWMYAAISVRGMAPIENAIGRDWFSNQNASQIHCTSRNTVGRLSYSGIGMSGRRRLSWRYLEASEPIRMCHRRHSTSFPWLPLPVGLGSWIECSR